MYKKSTTRRRPFFEAHTSMASVCMFSNSIVFLNHRRMILALYITVCTTVYTQTKRMCASPPDSPLHSPPFSNSINTTPKISQLRLSLSPCLYMYIHRNIMFSLLRVFFVRVVCVLLVGRIFNKNTNRRRRWVAPISLFFAKGNADTVRLLHTRSARDTH